MKTFIEKYLSTKGSREKEKFILKNLTVTKDAKIRKMRYGWSITFSWGLKWYAEFSDKSEILYFDEEIMGETSTHYPMTILFYKDKNGLPIKETDLTIVFESAYNTHKLLKA